MPGPDAGELRESLANSLTQAQARLGDGGDVALAAALRSLS